MESLETTRDFGRSALDLVSMEPVRGRATVLVDCAREWPRVTGGWVCCVGRVGLRSDCVRLKPVGGGGGGIAALSIASCACVDLVEGAFSTSA